MHLDEVAVPKELPDDFTMPSGKLPLTKSEVKIHFPTVGERRAITKYCKDKADKLNLDYKELEYEALLAKYIASVDGEELTTQDTLAFIRDLKGIDLAYIKHLIDKVDLGYPTELEIIDDKHGKGTGVLRITGEFFRPRFDD